MKNIVAEQILAATGTLDIQIYTIFAGCGYGSCERIMESDSRQQVTLYEKSKPNIEY